MKYSRNTEHQLMSALHLWLVLFLLFETIEPKVGCFVDVFMYSKWEMVDAVSQIALMLKYILVKMMIETDF